MVKTGGELFYLNELVDGNDIRISGDLSLDDFVCFVDAMDPLQERRMTKNDVIFARQLARKRGQ